MQSGAEIHGLSRAARSGDVMVHRRWSCDLADLTTTNRLLHAISPDYLIHLAGHVTGVRDEEEVAPTFRDDLMATVNVLSAATEVGCRRVVIAGSMDQPTFATVDSAPGSPYAAAKWAGSLYARMYHLLYGLDVVILRIFMVYGPGQRDETKLVPYVIRCLLRGEPPDLTSGRRPVDWVYVEDVAEAVALALHAPGVAGRTIDVGSGGSVEVRDIVERLVQLTDPQVRPRFGALKDRPLESTDVADLDATRAVLGWEPRTTLEQGLRQTVEWYVAEGKPGSAPTPART